LNDHRAYWENEWCSQTIDTYQSYLEGHTRAKPWFADVFQAYGVSRVCDAACGFGAYSAMLSANGYRVSGFDFSNTAVELTQQLLTRNTLSYEQIRVCDICKIDFPEGAFDAVVAHAVLDHLDVERVALALSELVRITKDRGLVYLSFDPLEQDDLDEPHEVLPDGSFLYTGANRNGLLFRYYSSAEIRALTSMYHILQWRCSKRGERGILLMK